MHFPCLDRVARPAGERGSSRRSGSMGGGGPRAPRCGYHSLHAGSLASRACCKPQRAASR